MSANAEEPVRRCAACGRLLVRGPTGLQCMACLLTLGTLEGEILEAVELLSLIHI